MRLITVFCLFGLLGCGLTQNPGLKIRLSQYGLNYAANKAIDVMEEKVMLQSIPNIQGTEKILKIGKVEYGLSNIRINSFIRGSTDIDVTNSGIHLKLANLGADLRGDWKYKIKVLVPIKDSGNFELTVRGASLSLGVTVDMNSDGRPMLHTTHCRASVIKVKIKFRKGASWLYNLFSKFIEKPIKKEIEKTLCKSIESAVKGNLADELRSIKVDFPIKDYGYLDYSLVAPPSFNGNSLESFHKGEFFWRADRIEAPFQPAVLPSSGNEHKMVTIWLSDYVPNTILHVLHTRGKLKKTIKAADLSTKDREHLAMDCKTNPLCIGSVFPESVVKRYKDSYVEIDAISTQRPELTFKSNSIAGKIYGKLTFRARNPKGDWAFLFSANATVDVFLTAHIDNNLIKFKASSIRTSLKPVDIGFTDKGFSVSSLSMLANIASKTAVIPKLNDIGATGIAIPQTKKIKYINPRLMIAQNALIAMLDIEMK